jgi:hypothetical protein
MRFNFRDYRRLASPRQKTGWFSFTMLDNSINRGPQYDPDQRQKAPPVKGIKPSICLYKLRVYMGIGTWLVCFVATDSKQGGAGNRPNCAQIKGSKNINHAEDMPSTQSPILLVHKQVAKLLGTVADDHGRRSTPSIITVLHF